VNQPTLAYLFGEPAALWLVGAFAVFFFLAWLGTTPWVRRRHTKPDWRAGLRRTMETGFAPSPVRRIPREVMERTKEFELLGFQRVVIGRSTRRSVQSVLVRSGDGVIAQTMRVLAGRFGPLMLCNLISVVEGRRGILMTAITDAGDRDYGPTHIVETFPGATPAFLAARHEEARRFLETEGIKFEAFGPDRVPDYLSWLTRETCSDLLDASDTQIMEIGRAILRPSMIPSFMRDQPGLQEKILALRG
jgi:hypothetical protein